jgi:predicted nuclease of predicted toxin-antitoxin system
MRFYLDEDLSDKIAAIARSYGVDVVSSHELGHDGSPDDVQLAIAVSMGRCIVTNNHAHFVALAEQYAQEGRPHSGMLLLAPSLPPNHFAAIARALAEYTRRYPGDGEQTDWLRPTPG